MTIEFHATKFSSRIELREYKLRGEASSVSEVVSEALAKQINCIKAISCQPDEMGTKSSVVRARRHAARAFGDTNIEVISSSNRKIWLKIDCERTPLTDLVSFLPNFWIVAWEKENCQGLKLNELRAVFELQSLDEQIAELLRSYVACARLWRDRQPLLQLFLPCAVQ